ncbi:MAG: type I-C CRISPR-associated protein Cas7/Csd2 [Oscillospiraceae bacterium]|jgi:CRISPR-associated protein Csd2|nr:type I-C CRISPR-associated protein Cas7/Csd2 [Oscillospiraceae bacterium]
MYDNAIKNRYDFVILYDVENGNPNGDPDAGNMPRVDPETGHGIVTDVCIKRKIRNYIIELVKDGEAGFDIYVRQNVTLNAQDAKGVEAVKDKRNKDEKSRGFRDFMCSNFYDIRTFGAVMTTAASDKELSNVAGQVRGPVQLAFGRSVDPIVPQEITITRVAITNEERARTASTEMGRKHIVPYGLYRQEGFISAKLAQKVTGFSENDLEILWRAIEHMFDEDRSAARGKMTLRELIIFKHESALGNAPSHKLFELVDIRRREGVETPRAYSDYELSIGAVPEGVTIERRS